MLILQLSLTIELSSMKNQYANFPAHGRDLKENMTVFFDELSFLIELSFIFELPFIIELPLIVQLSFTIELSSAKNQHCLLYTSPSPRDRG